VKKCVSLHRLGSFFDKRIGACFAILYLIEAFFNNIVLNDNSRSFVQSKVKVVKASKSIMYVVSLYDT
jgi:hypothetical protein